MILVMGDICIDKNYFGKVTRISPEAPIPIFEVESVTSTTGMSANIWENLKKAEEEVDGWGRYGEISKKNRYFVGNQMVYRIDENSKEPLSSTEQLLFLERIENLLPEIKTVILQDYAHGFFSEDFIQEILTLCKDKLIIADGHKSRSSEFYEGVDYLKLNEEEFKAICSTTKDDPIHYVRKGILVTRGDRGAILIKTDGTELSEKTYANKVVDVTGAGDTFTAHFAASIQKYDEKESLFRASVAAGISVEHLGCYAPTKEEIEDRISCVSCII